MKQLIKKKKFKDRKINKHIGVTSIDYEPLNEKDVDFRNDVSTFINDCNLDIYHLDTFYDKAISTRFKRVKNQRNKEHHIHESVIKAVENEKLIELSRLQRIKENSDSSIKMKEQILNSKTLSIVPFIPIIALVGDFINIFTKFEMILVESTLISVVLTIMICIVLDISPIALKDLIKTKSSDNKPKIVVLCLTIIITALIYLIICIGTIDTLYSASSILETKKELTIPEISVAILIAILPLISTALILGMDTESTIMDMIELIASRVTIKYDKWISDRVALQIDGLSKDLKIPYDAIDRTSYELILQNDEILKEEIIYRCKEELVKKKLNQNPDAIYLLMKMKGNSYEENK